MRWTRMWLVTVVALFALTPAALANTYRVTGTGDDIGATCFADVCPTLRAAVEAAASPGGPHTISLPAGTYQLTQRQLLLNSNVTIAGAGARTTAIRGNPEAFARTAIDAGADLVLGSGPHVLRAMEFYKKRLIAYSLGDFAGYHNFGIDGVLGISAILRVKLDATGKFLAGRIVPVRLVGAGQPVIDSSGAGTSVISELSREDIGAHAPHISPSGVISEP